MDVSRFLLRLVAHHRYASEGFAVRGPLHDHRSVCQLHLACLAGVVDDSVKSRNFVCLSLIQVRCRAESILPANVETIYGWSCAIAVRSQAGS